MQRFRELTVCRRYVVLRNLFLHPYRHVLVVLNIFLLAVLFYLHCCTEHRRKCDRFDARRWYQHLTEENKQSFQFIADYKTTNQNWDDVLTRSPVPTVRCFRKLRFPTVRRSQLHDEKHQWLVLNTSHNEIFVFSAYFDDRPTDEFSNLDFAVRILAMARSKISGQLYCQIFSGAGHAIVVARAFVTLIWPQRFDPRHEFYQPYLITCPVAKDRNGEGVARRPEGFVVSINDVPCVAHSNVALRVGVPASGRNSTVGNIAVCVKGLDFVTDYSVRLVEWIEATFVMSADRIVFYTYAVPKTMASVIEMYESGGRLVHLPISLPGNMPNVPWVRNRFVNRNRLQKRRLELIPYNDCLYRHLYSHRYILLVDVDELIVPRRHRNWYEMLEDIVRQASTARWPPESFTGVAVSNAFFFDNMTVEQTDLYPPYMHMLRHTRRSASISKRGFYCKSFMVVSNVKTVFNHYPLDRLRRNLRPNFHVDSTVAIKNHYKETCPFELNRECADLFRNVVVDDGLLRFASQLTANVNNVVSALHLNVVPP